jgi:hypothetical protein
MFNIYIQFKTKHIIKNNTVNILQKCYNLFTDIGYKS